MFFDAWAQRGAQTQDTLKSARQALRKIDAQIDRFLDRITDTASDTAAKAYERKIETLERERLILEEKVATIRSQMAPDSDSAREKLELCFKFLANPWKLWTSEVIQHRRLVLRLAFADRLDYCRKTGPRTPKTTLPFKVLGDFLDPNGEVVRTAGLEPA
ncbi:MAG: hypothetical protein AAGE92_17570 [Cyanobacteria bacterium P01_G01_bin.4]